MLIKEKIEEIKSSKDSFRLSVIISQITKDDIDSISKIENLKLSEMVRVFIDLGIEQYKLEQTNKDKEVK